MDAIMSNETLLLKSNEVFIPSLTDCIKITFDFSFDFGQFLFIFVFMFLNVFQLSST